MSQIRVGAVEHLASCGRADQFPPPRLPEVALLGRSNVGKSSLLNRMVGRKQLARTSKTPGKTRIIHFYSMELEKRALLLVDLPGYGYARVSRREREGWQRLVEGYLEQRECLRVAILLHDLRREPSEDETLLLDWLAEQRIPALVALTKVDKLKPMRRAERVRKLRETLQLSPERVVATSAQTGEGIAELWSAIQGRL